ncbi:MAG: cytochrome P450, partial [Allosphingosinicella sp.]
LYDEAGTLLGSAVINLHGEAHRARRGEELKIFRKDFFQYYEKNVLARELDDTLSPYVASGEADMVDLGYRLMLNLTADFAGVDRPGRSREATEDLCGLLRTFTLAPVLDQSTLGDTSALKARLAAGIHAFDRRFLTPSIDRRLGIIAAVAEGREPETALPRDVLTILLQAREKLGMGHSELLQEIIFFLLAGSHTSVHALTHVLGEMFEWFEAHPEDRVRAASDPLFIQRCVHESLRLYPSSPIAKRRPDCPMNIAPIGEVGKDDDIVIHLDQANRDVDAFGADAKNFCPHRAVVAGISPYGLSMGMGMHSCLGLNLAVGVVPKPGSDPATHHYGTVPMIVSALIAAGVRPHPEQVPLRDSTTTRATWARFPVAFGRTRAPQPAAARRSRSLSAAPSP